MNNLRQLMLGWRMYADDFSDSLLAAREWGGIGKRVVWVTGDVDLGNGANNWDVNLSVAKSPLVPYTGKNFAIWRCPADKVTVKATTAQGPQIFPRVRSNSMSQVFDEGVWLPTPPWRTYGKMSNIAIPVKTWVLVDEHPESLNDAACAVKMAMPGDSPGTVNIIDYPASYHNGACGLSFADGHSEIHKWIGSNIKRARLQGLNVPATDSVNDIIWWSSVTTVK